MTRHNIHIVTGYAEHRAVCSTCGWCGPFHGGDSWTEPGRRDARQHLAEVGLTEKNAEKEKDR